MFPQIGGILVAGLIYNASDSNKLYTTLTHLSSMGSPHWSIGMENDVLMDKFAIVRLGQPTYSTTFAAMENYI